MRALLTMTMLVAATPLFAAFPTKVSDNGRYLVTSDGKPFFWLGDTAWELFHRLTREEADEYLRTRAAQGYTVIQAVALAEFDGLTAPNAYGHLPLKQLDPGRPDVQPGPANDYWDHVDHIVDRANTLGLTIGFLPTWGDKFNKKWGAGPEVFTPENAEAYGVWLGERYKGKGLVWILGGDRPIETDQHRAIIRAMAKGLARGDGGAHLMTYHPMGSAGSSQYFPDEPWLDFHMRQNGHVAEYDGRYDQTRVDYDRSPTKPVLDGEPIYEGHPINFKANAFGHSLANDVRRPLYWDLFSGACGHTYGHHSVWQMADPRHQPVNNPLMSWRDALQEPGGIQMQHGRRLMESRPWETFVPDNDVIVTSDVPTNEPGAGRYRFVATRAADGSCAMVYAPAGRKFTVRLDKVTGSTIRAWWYNPRTGVATELGTMNNSGTETFTPEHLGEALDCVLVLDDAGRKYPPPGSVK
jgi:hypothetical protein